MLFKIWCKGWEECGNFNETLILLYKISVKKFFWNQLKTIYQGVSVRPFLALSRAQRSLDLYLERTSRAHVWFLVIFCKFCKSHDGYQFRLKLALELPNGIRSLIQTLSFQKSKCQVFQICNRLCTLDVLWDLLIHSGISFSIKW